jgi:hypothetical protein
MKYNDELSEIVGAFYEKSKKGIVDNEALILVSRWQKYLSREHYDCTDEMLECLGKMYPSDEFRDKIDVYGEGTADFMSKAILEFCRQKKNSSGN